MHTRRTHPDSWEMRGIKGGWSTWRVNLKNSKGVITNAHVHHRSSKTTLSYHAMLRELGLAQPGILSVSGCTHAEHIRTAERCVVSRWRVNLKSSKGVITNAHVHHRSSKTTLSYHAMLQELGLAQPGILSVSGCTHAERIRTAGRCVASR